MTHQELRNRIEAERNKLILWTGELVSILPGMINEENWSGDEEVNLQLLIWTLENMIDQLNEIQTRLG